MFIFTDMFPSLWGCCFFWVWSSLPGWPFGRSEMLQLGRCSIWLDGCFIDGVPIEIKSSAFGWSWSLGVPHLPQLYLSIPRSFLHLHLSFPLSNGALKVILLWLSCGYKEKGRLEGFLGSLVSNVQLPQYPLVHFLQAFCVLQSHLCCCKLFLSGDTGGSADVSEYLCERLE
jgi:hypothetical protein